MSMKRWMAFACDYCYPSGGIHDMVGTYNTREEAEQTLDGVYSGYDAREIYDTWTGELWAKIKPDEKMVKDKSIWPSYHMIPQATPTEYTLAPRREVAKS